MWSSTLKFRGIGSKSVYRHHRARYPLFKSDNFPEKSQQAPVCALTQPAQQGTVVLEIDSKHDGNTENIFYTAGIRFREGIFGY